MNTNEQTKKNTIVENSPLINDGTMSDTVTDNSQDNSIQDISIDSDKKATNKVYNIQNLKPVRSKDEARERGRKGGLKSGEVRRQKKTMREGIQDILSKPIKADILKQYGLDGVVDTEGATYLDAIIAAALGEALSGDIKAAVYLRDTAGEQPTLKTENKTEIITQEDMQTMDNLRKYLTG